MSDTVIKIEGLSKKYLLAHKGPRGYIALRDVLAERAKRLGRRLAHPFAADRDETPGPGMEEFWALKDVSFEVKQGERLGIIGRNGAGKSTLLKILSRITEPTAGRVSIRGRIASLLEVGTGFHPELTGRENVYLNGAILGMSRVEIRKNFDAIVDFAGVEKFLDTPVKRYSSGMYVRLAFAVAAHLDTEILLVDEVLAVGDAEFQKKCLGKMDEISHKQGRTILFVSHNMPMVASLCETGVWLDHGEAIDKGGISRLISRYTNHNRETGAYLEFAPEEFGDEVAELIAVSVENKEGKPFPEYRIDEPIYLKMKYRVKKENVSLTPNFHIYDSRGQCVFIALDSDLDYEGTMKSVPGEYLASCLIPANFLNDGTYSAGYALTTLATVEVHYDIRNIINFIVIDDMHNISTRGLFRGFIPGVVRPLLDWKSEKIS